MPEAAGAPGGPVVAVPPARFRPETQQQLAPSGERARLRANLAAVRLVKQLERQQRPATAEDQQVLARWSGWGAIPQALDPLQGDEFWVAARQEVQSLLAPEEFRAAERNVLNAHYTELGLARAMWGGLVRLGIPRDETLVVLEPGCGSGNFLASAPANARVTGVELDPITARIAGLLYPDATIRAESFAKTPLPLPGAEAGVDVVVGNVPFGSYPLYDPVHNRAKHSIHNHFLVKGLHALRPGGLLMVITSRYTMDARSSVAREQMAGLADLVGAVRLPSSAHKRAAGTETVTDVLILRRRSTGEPASESFAEWRDAVGFAGSEDVAVNQYFTLHPELVLGAMELVDGAHYAKQDLAVDDSSPAQAADQLGDALDRIATQASAHGLWWSPRTDSPVPAVPEPSDRTRRARRGGRTSVRARRRAHASPTSEVAAAKDTAGPVDPATDPAMVALLEQIAGQVPRPDGTILAVEDGFVVLDRGEQVEHPVPASQAAELRALLRLRDLAVGLLQVESDTPRPAAGAGARDGERDPEQVGQLRAALNTEYDAYVEAYGLIGRWTTRRTGRVTEDGEPVLGRQYPRQGGFGSDPYAPVVQALEQVSDDGRTATKASIFTQRVVAARPERVRADDPGDALAVCMDRHGEVRLPVIATLLGSGDEAQARRALGQRVFDDPERGGRLVPAAEYLSGLVRDKLVAAQAAAEHDPDRYSVNVQALQQVIPRDLRPGEIEARLGASWIRPGYVQQFARELLDDLDVEVRYDVEQGVGWTVRGGRGGVLATATWGTKRRPAPVLIESLLSNRPVRVVDEIEDADGKTRRVLNLQETAAARDKASEINARFSEWIWEDPRRADECARDYNDTFNNLVLRTYDTASLTLPGLTHHFTPRPHQLAAVARITNEPAVLLAHEVGAGKTAEMVMGAMELRRLGLASKPAIVVPNHMLEQFAREFLQLYPNARVLAMGMDDLQGEKRRRAVARAATGDWDAVILTRSAFERLPVHGSTRNSYVASEMGQLRQALDEARRGGDDQGSKNSQLAVARAEAGLEGNLDSAKDAGLSFEATGIDYLFVDEAHAYKRLQTRSNDRTLGIPDGSKRAEDLHMKIQYLRERNDTNRVVTFATATPLTNTMAEAYVMQRFLRPDILARTGTDNFDAWVSTFGEQVTSMELAVDGSGFKEKTRLAKFHNTPELLRMFHVPADVKTAEDLNLDTPRIAGGKAETVVIESTDPLDAYMANLADRAEDVRNKRVDRRVDHMALIGVDGRKAALDLRLVDEDQPDPSKAATVANRVAQIHHAHREDVLLDPATGEEHPTRGSLQIVFLDLSTPKPHGEWSAYEEITRRLTEQGVPRDQIRWVQDYKKDREKAELFRACREGKVAVLMGSSETIGVGTNVQTRAVALHHVDCHWLPAMIAQREGRIIRQGNQHPEVQILAYVTEGSFDAYMWQTCERKARFINQIMRGRLDQREVEEIGETVLSYAEIKALATGNPLLLDKATADAELAKLERRARAHQHTQQSLQRSIEESTRRIDEAQVHQASINAAISRRRDTRGEAFTMRIDTTTYTDRSNAGADLRDTIRPLLTSWGTDRIAIGELGGQTLTAHRRLTANGRQAEVYLDEVPVTAVTYSMEDLEPNASPVGLITRLEHKIAGLDKALTKLRTTREQILDEKTRAEAEYPKPFPDNDALQAARRRVQDIDDQLAEHQGTLHNTAEDLTAQQALDGSTPTDSALLPYRAMAFAETLISEARPPASTKPEKETVTSVTEDSATDAADGLNAANHRPADHAASADHAGSLQHDPDDSQPSPRADAINSATDPAATSAGTSPTIHITRNTRGYIVTGTSRTDRELHRVLRESRFAFSSRQGGFWYLPSRMLPRTQEQWIRHLTAKLRTLGRRFNGPDPTTDTATDTPSEPALSRRFSNREPARTTPPTNEISL